MTIVIVSASWQRGEVDKTFRAMEAGALTALEKPVSLTHPQYERLARELTQVVKVMAGVRVVQRKPMSVGSAGPPRGHRSPRTVLTGRGVRLVAIGASTGGPSAIMEILKGMPRDFPAPVLIVQHIAQGFVQGFADWLAESSGLPVTVAQHGERPQRGHAYVAPDGLQMGLLLDGSIALGDEAPEAGLRPSVSDLFRSLAGYPCRGTVAVLLTGMGKDGARELKLLKDCGAVTVAQDKESCIVYGMPAEAAALDAASHVLAPAKIAEFLAALTTDDAAGAGACDRPRDKE